MPTLINKKTKQEYPVSADDFKHVMSNAETKELFEEKKEDAPPEVKEMSKKREPSATVGVTPPAGETTT